MHPFHDIFRRVQSGSLTASASESFLKGGYLSSLHQSTQPRRNHTVAAFPTPHSVTTATRAFASSQILLEQHRLTSSNAHRVTPGVARNASILLPSMSTAQLSKSITLANSGTRILTKLAHSQSYLLMLNVIVNKFTLLSQV